MPLLTPDEALARVRERAQSVGARVAQAWNVHLAAALPRASVLAVGGFGRAELFPHSDVDVLVLLPDGVDPASCRIPVGGFVQDLWDAGFRLSHSVRNVSECLTLHDQNIELNASLLDRRFLCGAPEPWSALEAGWPQFARARSRDLARGIARLTKERHAKFHNTIFQLEPNIKESPGALRDLNVIRWLAPLVSSDPPPPFEEAERFLYPVRWYLHEQARRDHNVLEFEAQEQLGPDPAAAMREYYRHARAIFGEATRRVDAAHDRGASLMDQFRDWRTRLSNSEFTVSRDRVFVRSIPMLESDPDLAVRLFAFLGRHDLALAADTETRLIQHFSAPELPQPKWPQWRSILLQQHAATGLRAMQSTGALPAWMPEWKRIECLVVRDFYHRYTVDEHTIVAVETLEAIQDSRFRELFSEIDRPDLLRFALLLHDVGKGGGNHVAVSRRIATEICSRLEVPEIDSETVLFLIDDHLTLSSVMSARDMGDPTTARHIADRVGTVERLKLLTLVTYADISAVQPGAMSAWRAEQLWRSYLAGYEELTRELATQRIHAPTDVRSDIADFLEGFPTRYQRTHVRSEIDAHFQLATASQKTGAAATVNRLNGFHEATIATKDRPGLFAALSGALSAFGLNILKADAFSNANGLVLDRFIFSDPMRNLDQNPSEVERLETTLVRVALGREDVRKLLQRRPKPVVRTRVVDPKIHFDNAASPNSTLIEIIAEDRPGLLYDLASTLSDQGCSIEVVLIDTEGRKALDVFYVTQDGKALPADTHDSLRAKLLAACGQPAENSSARKSASLA